MGDLPKDGFVHSLKITAGLQGSDFPVSLGGNSTHSLIVIDLKRANTPPPSQLPFSPFEVEKSP